MRRYVQSTWARVLLSYPASSADVAQDWGKLALTIQICPGQPRLVATPAISFTKGSSFLTSAG